MDIQGLDSKLPQDPGEAFLYLAATFPDRVVFTTSFGKEDQIITHMLADVGANIRLVTLDTGRLFPETYDTIERTTNRYNLPLEVFYPHTKRTEQFVSKEGINPFYKSVELRKECCSIRKIEPLKRALAGSEIWITGLRADQSDNRSSLPRLQQDALTGLIKYNPLLSWDDEAVDSFVDRHNIPVNPLHNKGFLSIGCAPCTRAVLPGEHARAGRWWWESSKKECGLHQHENHQPSRAKA